MKISRFKLILVIPFILLVTISTMVLCLSVPKNAPVNTKELQKKLVSSLLTYKDVNYSWGGERHSGIDCSGLVRRGLIEALYQQGLEDFNLRLLKDSLHLRWNDFAAKDMRAGLGGWLVPILKVEKLKDLDPKDLLPGDVAVTQSGVHVLEYLGNGDWIQADPVAKKVTITKAPDATLRSWFITPVSILRWKYFADAPGETLQSAPVN